MVAAETESRFASTPHFGGNATKIPTAAKPFAPLAGLQELWEPDSQQLHFFPEIVQKTQPGEQWTLNVSPDSTVPVIIERTVVAPTPPCRSISRLPLPHGHKNILRFAALRSNPPRRQ